MAEELVERVLAMSIHQFLEKIDQEKKDYIYLSVSTRASEESKMVEHCLH